MKEYNKLLPLRQLQHRLKKQQEKNKSLSLKLKQTRLDLRTSKARANKEQKRKLELIEINKDQKNIINDNKKIIKEVEKQGPGYKNLINFIKKRNEQKRKNKAIN